MEAEDWRCRIDQRDPLQGLALLAQVADSLGRSKSLAQAVRIAAVACNLYSSLLELVVADSSRRMDYHSPAVIA